MRIRIEPYKLWSGGAKALGVHAGILRATKRQVGKWGDFDLVINWGRSQRRFDGEYINDPEKVAIASNKLGAAKCFDKHGVPQPAFTESREGACQWIGEGNHVIARKLLRASQGRGIILVGPSGSEITDICEVPAAPLYTKYVKKADEYRVHVAFGKVIDVQKKKRRLEVPDDDVNWQIRNSHNGWLYAREDISPPDCVLSAAVLAVDALGLSFGAVDAGYNAKGGATVVYEVNTAPGLEGQTLESYYQAFTEEFPQLKGGAYNRRRNLRGG